MTKTIAAVFDTREQAAEAANEIKAEGFRIEDISIIARGSDKGGDWEEGRTNEDNSWKALGGDKNDAGGIYGTGAGDMYGTETGMGVTGGLFTGVPGMNAAGTGIGTDGMYTGAESRGDRPSYNEDRKSYDEGRKSKDTEISEELSGDKKKVKDNISDGVIAGGILGSLAGLLIGAGSMVIPGLGIIAAAGPITGILAGGATGAIVGGLIDLGIPEHKSKEYETDIKAGKILFSMKADKENFERIGKILRKHGAISVETY